jgi:fucose 4-O-acetylase-like acetyltransferase
MPLSSERRYDLDWLRVLGVLLLIPFHVALIFVLQPYTIMYIRDVVNSPTLSGTTGFIHMWHMPMLFMISGAATYFALGFRSAGEYVRERFLRLFIPLIFGLATYVPFTIYIRTAPLRPHICGSSCICLSFHWLGRPSLFGCVLKKANRQPKD